MGSLIRRADPCPHTTDCYGVTNHTMGLVMGMGKKVKKKAKWSDRICSMHSCLLFAAWGLQEFALFEITVGNGVARTKSVGYHEVHT